MKLYESIKYPPGVPKNRYPTYGKYIEVTLLKFANEITNHSYSAAKRIEDFVNKNKKLIYSYGEKINLDGGHETDTSIFDLLLNGGLTGMERDMKSYVRLAEGKTKIGKREVYKGMTLTAKQTSGSKYWYVSITGKGIKKTGKEVWPTEEEAIEEGKSIIGK